MKVSMEKERLDALLVRQGHAQSRERARALIMEGKVLVDGVKLEKPGTQVPVTAKVRLLGEDLPFVSRGGLKLAKAIETFGLILQDKVAADIGASTGGFTDCALQNGAKRVYAIDVGYGQLAWKLRTDPRVVNMERTNARYVKPEDLPESVDFISIDVAFISLEKVLPVAYQLLTDGGQIVALIKPQFEAGRSLVGKKGVVKAPKVHAMVIANVLHFATDMQLTPIGLTYSPVKGPEGNIEYLVLLTKDATSPKVVATEQVPIVVQAAHDALDV